MIESVCQAYFFLGREGKSRRGGVQRGGGGFFLAFWLPPSVLRGSGERKANCTKKPFGGGDSREQSAAKGGLHQIRFLVRKKARWAFFRQLAGERYG